MIIVKVENKEKQNLDTNGLELFKSNPTRKSDPKSKLIRPEKMLIF